MFAPELQSQFTEQNELSLRSESGELLHSFPTEIVASTRRMLTTLIYQSSLPRIIACLAALPGEGVTYNTLALGTTLASDIDASVCIVELNWWSPGLQKLLAYGPPPAGKPRRKRKRAELPEQPAATPRIPTSAGVAGVLAGKASLEEALLKTSLPNLDLLPAGDMPLFERAITARGAPLKEFIEELRDHYDYVLLDLPAVGRTSDAVALGSLSEALCVVVMQGVTNTNTVKQALDEIKHLPVLGVILNRVRLHTPRWIFKLLPQE